MDRPRWIRWMVPLIALLLGATPALAEEPPAETPAWRDAAKVEALLGPACDMVESICARAFKTRPTVVISDGEQVGKIALANLARVPEAVMSADEREAARQFLSEGAMGIYEAAAHRIHICPDAIETAVRVDDEDVPFTEDMLRLLLVHEATHALDEERPGWPSFFERLESADALMALGAVSEGHAQWVTEQAAKAWKIEPAFAALVHHILGSGVKVEGGPLVEAMVAAVQSAVSFAYVQGHRFFSAVETARGREGVEAILASPPTSTRVIERPAWFLDPSLAAQEMDLKPLLDAFRPLIADPIWQTQELRLMEGMLKSQAVRLPEELRAEFARGFEDGQILMATPTGEEAQVLVAIMRFATPGDAAFFMGHQRKMVEAAAEQIPAFMLKANETHDGVGAPVPGAVGFHVYRELDVPTGPMAIRVVSFHVGRVAFEVTVVNVPGETAESLASFVRYVTKRVVDPEGVTAADRPKDRTFRSSQPAIDVTVVTPDGDAVPRCRVLRQGLGDGPMDDHVEVVDCRDGRCRVRGTAPDADNGVRLRAVHPREENDAPMDLSDSGWLEVEPGVGEARLTLRTGGVIEGRVTHADGSPTAGLEVRVRKRNVDHVFKARDMQAEEHLELRATVSETGTFRVVGAPTGRMEVRVFDGDRPLLPQALPAQAGAEPLDIVLTPVVDVEIRVVDEAGEPLAHVHVLARRSLSPGDSLDALDFQNSRSAFTDHRGMAVLKGLDPAARYDLSAMFVGDERGPRIVPVRRSRWRPANTTITMTEGWTLRGRVVDVHGQGTRAQVVRRTEDGTVIPVSTGPDGQFELTGVAKGPVEILVLPPGDFLSTLYEVTDGWQTFEQTEDVVTLTLGASLPPGMLHMRVLDDRGRPVPSARALIQSRAQPGTRALSDVRQGHLIVKRWDGEIVVTIYQAKDAVKRPLRLKPLQRIVLPSETGVIEVRMAPGRQQTGRIVDAQGEPLAGIGVHAIPHGQVDLGFGNAQRAHASAHTNMDGRFRLIGLGDGFYDVVLDLPLDVVSPAPMHFRPGNAPLTWVIPEQVPVTVVDGTGAPVEGAIYSLWWVEREGDEILDHHALLKGHADAQGRIQLVAPVDHEEFHLTVEAPEGSPWLPAFLEPWRPSTRKITLEAGRVIRGHVRDDGGPVVGAQVTFSWVSSDGERRYAWARTEENGAFVSPALRRIPIQVSASLGPLRLDEDSPDARAGPVDVALESSSVDLILVPVPRAPDDE